MPQQGRSKLGQFTSKSSQFRKVRTVRLTDSTWEKLGQAAAEMGMTRADFIEYSASRSNALQLDLFGLSSTIAIHSSKEAEVITKDTRKNGTGLANRLGVSSAALTNWLKVGQMPEKTKAHDPDGIAWERIPGSTKYRPIL